MLRDRTYVDELKEKTRQHAFLKQTENRYEVNGRTKISQPLIISILKRFISVVVLRMNVFT